MKNTKISRIGDTQTNNFGSLMSICGYRNNKDIDIVFLESGYTIYHKAYNDFLIGRISSPYERRSFGVAYLGEGKHKTRENNKKTNKYTSWHRMFIRCYSKDFQKTRPTYLGCTVSPEWFNFQNFGDWYDKNYYKVEGQLMSLDKDIVIKGNKIYSPETCVFVPISINSLFVKCNTRRGELPIGVNYAKNRCHYEAKCVINNRSTQLGTYKSSLEAFNSYKIAKEKYIKEIADKYRNVIPPKLYDAMYRYQVEITD